MESHQNPFTDPMSSSAVAYCPPHPNSEANLMNIQVTALKLNCPRAEYVLTGCPCFSPVCSCQVYSTAGENLGKYTERTCASAAPLKLLRWARNQMFSEQSTAQHIATVQNKNFPSVTPIHVNKSQLTNRKGQFRGQ